MKNKKIIYGIIISLLTFFMVSTSLVFFKKSIDQSNDPTIPNDEVIPDNDDEDDDVVVVTGPKLTCYEYIDKMLVADGFTYLLDAKWGRGVKNFFLIDVVAQEFQMASYINTNVLPVTWYLDEFQRYVDWTYSYADKVIWSSSFLNSGGKKDSPAAKVYAVFSDVTSYAYEYPYWMQYYNEQTEKYGCSLTGLTKEKLLGEYKTKLSSATLKDVVSVFDRKSTDGILRYYADAHVDGRVEDNPRYKELNSVKEYMALDNAENWEVHYMVNVLFRDPTKRVYFPNLSGIQPSVIKEFTKDVVFTKTTSIVDDPRNQTIGVYFIYIDNPNGEFEYMYEAPKPANSGGNFSIDKFNKIKMPFESFIMLVNKSQVAEQQVYHTGAGNLYEQLKVYLQFIHDVNPRFKYSDDFLTYYTRPFNPDWQAMMGLTEFFDAKYGFTNRNVKYYW